MAILAAAGLGACVSMPERMEFSRDIYGLSKDADCEAMAHQLWSMHCDLNRFGLDYFERAKKSSRNVSALDWTALATTLGVGGIVALGGSKDGTLSSGKLNTAENLTYGGAVLSAGRQFLNPDGARDTNLRAYYAFSCASTATLMALQREPHVRRSMAMKQDVEQALEDLEALRDELALLIGEASADEMDELGSDLQAVVDAALEQAKNTVEAAEKSIARVDQNAGAYVSLPFRLVETRDTIYRQVLQREVSNQNALSSAYQAFQSTLQQQQQFVSASSGMSFPSPIVLSVGGDSRSGEAIDRDIGPLTPIPPSFADDVEALSADLIQASTELAEEVRKLSAATPNIVTISAHLDQCAAIVSTGVVVDAPKLEDVGPAMPPGKAQAMFDIDLGG